jgi:hypothetical protein
MRVRAKIMYAVAQNSEGAAMADIRGRGRPFRKGQSGNPGGRPKGDGEIRELARQHTALALRTLSEIADHGENESARVAAANALLDRGYGKPAVPVAAAELPEAITINFGTTLRPPNGSDGETARTLNVATPQLLPPLDDE